MRLLRNSSVLLWLLLASPVWAGGMGGVANLADYGANILDTGAVNDMAFLKAFGALGANGGTVWVTPADGCYQISMSLRIPLGATLAGAGQRSCITLPDHGWPIEYGAKKDAGMIVVNHRGFVTITGVRLRGSVDCLDEFERKRFCPVGILFNSRGVASLRVSHVRIEQNIIERFKHTAVIPNGEPELFQGFSILSNYFDDIGMGPVGDSGTRGFAIETSMEHSVIAGNIVRHSWAGIANVGRHNVITQNILECVALKSNPPQFPCLYTPEPKVAMARSNVVTGNLIRTIQREAGR